MAESVDALVSNTSRFTPVPVRPRLWVLNEESSYFSRFFYLYLLQLYFHHKFLFNKNTRKQYDKRRIQEIISI